MCSELMVPLPELSPGAGSSPSVAEWVAWVPLATGIVVGTSPQENHTFSVELQCLLSVKEMSFSLHVRYVQSTVHTWIFKVDRHLECCMPLCKPEPHADQVRHMRRSVEGKCEGPEGFTKNRVGSKCATEDKVSALEEGLQHPGADLNAPYLKSCLAAQLLSCPWPTPARLWFP